MNSIDVGLEGLQKSQSKSESPAIASSPDKSVKESEIEKKSSTIRDLRKGMASLTGIHGFFSGKKVGNEPEVKVSQESGEVDELDKMSNETESIASEESSQIGDSGANSPEIEKTPSQPKEEGAESTSPMTETSQIAEPAQEELSPLKKLENYIGNPAASNLLMGFIGNTEMKGCAVADADVIAMMGKPKGDVGAAKEKYKNFVDTFIRKQGVSAARAALNVAFKGYPEAKIPDMMSMVKSEADGKISLYFDNSEDSIQIGDVAICSITYPADGAKDDKATLEIAVPNGVKGWVEGSKMSLTVKL